MKTSADRRESVGRSVAATPECRALDLSNSEPLWIGFGAQTHFGGAISDVRLYARALKAEGVGQIHAHRTAQCVSRIRIMNEKRDVI